MSEAVRGMFGGIAPKYDRANAVLSLGQHQRWRRRLVKLSGALPGDEVLDVATGTGDLALLFRERVGRAGLVVGIDFSRPMIDIAASKAKAKGLSVEFREADALKLPFGDDEFDVASIAFGIRNVDDPARALREMARVLRPGGRIAVLEFGQPGGFLKPFYRIYSRYVIPRVGGGITGHRDAYEYLDRTAARFPAGKRFVKLMESTNRFRRIEATPLTGGIVYAYIATVK